MKIEVKICGITRRADAEAAAELGFDYVGAVLFAGSRRYVPVAKLPELFGGLPAKVKRVGVFVDAAAAEIEAALATGCLDIVQLHGGESAEFAIELGERVIVWKAVTLAGADDIGRFAAFPAARLVLDSSGGGSGRCCDWRLAARMAARRPVMLAGGITPANAAAAVAAVNPAGIDLAGGVELAYGIKSLEKMIELKDALNQHE